MPATNLIYPEVASEETCSSDAQFCRQRQGSGVSAPNSKPHPDPKAAVRWCDPCLLMLVRAGEVSAFAELFLRYRNLATYVARVESDNPSDMDDVVGEAFASVFQALVVGRGPADSFRAYLLTAVRRTAHRRNVQARRSGFLSDVPQGGDTGYDDPSLQALETSSLTESFRSLPARWQAVLWYSEVEAMKPAEVAPIMGLTPNSVSALLIRARKGLRKAFLQNQVEAPRVDSCAEVSRHFGRFVLSDGRMAGSEKIRRHVSGCTECEVALAALREMRSAMKGSG
ncbi:sigma-70 family RNA polymerase sigma factor [Arthrobacter sp. FW305-123]|nr:sigma-70 family RNA polymerase sigma factor [Arthrobacter sp. FW305-123]